MTAERASRSSHPVPALEAIRLTLDYETDSGPLRAVESIDFRIHKSERLVLLGPSGCGKSSILKAVAGFVPPTTGRILVNGADIEGAGPDRIVVFQEFDQLLPWKTVRDNVAFPLRVARGLSASEARDAADAALIKVGLERALDAFPHTLSGGMKQRAAIARALAAKPDILLMDEPFAALDEITRFRLNNDLLALWRDLSKTIIFVTHSVFESVYLSQRVIVMTPRPGRIGAEFRIAAPEPRGEEFRTSADYAALCRDVSLALSRTGDAAARA
jgi:NitT/TauT family transport system ATP-binding protein